jgi:hypothetical protein
MEPPKLAGISGLEYRDRRGVPPDRKRVRYGGEKAKWSCDTERKTVRTPSLYLSLYYNNIYNIYI